MKRIGLLSFTAMLLLLASCQSIAEKSSGNYSGTWTASGPGFTTSNGIGNATLAVTPDGNNKVDMVFTSPGNPNVNIQDVEITDLFGVYMFNLNDDMGGNIQVDGTIAAGILVLTYDNAIDSVELSLANFTK